MSRKMRFATALGLIVAMTATGLLSSAGAQADTSWGAPLISLLG